MASAFPKRSSIPPVSARVRMPCSKQSMAKAIVAPVEMVSRPYCAQIWLASDTACRSPTQQ